LERDYSGAGHKRPTDANPLKVDRPGPIYLQGDHTGIEYRNIYLRPVIE
jgi:hypothetical protein